MQGLDQLLSLDAMNPQMQQAARVLAKVLATELNRVLRGDAKRGIDDLAGDAQDALKDVFSDLDRQVDVSYSKVRKMTEDITRGIEDAKKKWGEMLNTMNTRAPGMGLGTAMGGAAGQLSQMMGGFGSGAGVIGWMMAGKKAEQDWAAAGARLANAFKAAGATNEGTFKAMTATVRGLATASQATEAEIAGVINALTASGFQEGVARMSVTVRGVTDDVVTMGLRMDAAFGQSAGVTSALSAQLAVLSNTSLPSGLRLVTDIGAAARGMGMSFQQATGAIMQTSSALRMQLVEGRQLGDMMGRMQSYFKGTGMTSQTAGAFAATAMQGVGQSIAGMSDALKGFIGSQVGNQTGAAAVVDFERGIRGSGGKDFFGKTVATIIEQVRGISSNPLEQQFALQKLYGMPPEAAEALLGIAADGADSKTIAERAAQQSADLMGALNDKALNVATYERVMKKIQDILDRIGAALFGLISTSLVMLVDILAGIAGMIGAFFTHGGALGGGVEAAGEFFSGTLAPRVTGHHVPLLEQNLKNLTSAASDITDPTIKAAIESTFPALRGEADYMRSVAGSFVAPPGTAPTTQAVVDQQEELAKQQLKSGNVVAAGATYAGAKVMQMIGPSVEAALAKYFGSGGAKIHVVVHAPDKSE